MKIKIVCIAISMLLFATTISVAKTVNNNEITIENIFDNPGGLPTRDTEDWPMKGLNSHHTGVSLNAVPPNSNDILYTLVKGSVWSSPAVVDDRVYFGVGGLTDYTGNRAFYCVDEKTSEVIWTINDIGCYIASPCVWDGKVYFIQDNEDSLTPKYLYCVDAEGNGDGTTDILWQVQHLGGDARGSPVISDGKLFFGDWTTLYCINAIDGTEHWNYSIGENKKMWTSPAIINDKVYFGTNQGRVYCLDIESGSLLWSYLTGGEIAVGDSLVYDVRGDILYISSEDGNIYGLNPEDGSEVTLIPIKGRVAAYSYGIFIVGEDGLARVADSSGYVYFEFNTNLGALQPLDARAAPSAYLDMGDIDNSRMIFIYKGTLFCINPIYGEEYWRYQLDDYDYGKNQFSAQPVIANDHVYVGTYDRSTDKGTLYCFGPNEAPEQPNAPVGPTMVSVDKEHTYTTKAIEDPDGDSIRYGWDFDGDNNADKWTDDPTVAKEWTEDGIFAVRVVAKDSHDAYSEFSEPLIVFVTEILLKEVSGGIGVSAVIKNVGDNDAFVIDWSINISGGVIFYPSDVGFSGTAYIAAEEEITVSTGLLFGFGKIDIVVTVNDQEQTASGLLLGPFVLI